MTNGSDAAAACVGDCADDGVVTVDEIITGVNIALGTMSLTECPPFDVSADGVVTVDELILAVNSALEGCTVPPTRTPMPTWTPTPTAGPINLERYDAGFFNIQKPTGWNVYIGGVCSTLGLLIRDPVEPLRQIFYFGEIGPVYLKEQQRAIDLDYINHGGYNFITWLDAPAVDPLTVENYFVHWPGIAAMKAATEFMPQFPKLTGLTVASSTPLSAMIPGGSTALLRGVFMEDGRVAEGQFLGTTAVFSPFTGVPGGGTAYGMIILGITTPKGQFQDAEAKLVASLESFTMTQDYITWCIQHLQQLWGAVAEEGQTLRETSDMIFDGWQSRSQSSDIMAEQYSDTLLGVERVYDPATNQVYEVPNGWYATYDLHRGDYSMNDLQTLPADNYSLWMSAPADGSAIH